jgi:hypothetical protein
VPIKDILHDAFVRALIKAGGTILNEQVLIKIPKRRLWVDIRALRNGLRILIEVKSFGYDGTSIAYLASAIGKYLLYQAVLEHIGNDTPLFLAVPTFAYEGILSETIGQVVIQKAKVKLIVFDPEREEITQWIN